MLRELLAAWSRPARIPADLFGVVGLFFQSDRNSRVEVADLCDDRAALSRRQDRLVRGFLKFLVGCKAPFQARSGRGGTASAGRFALRPSQTSNIVARRPR